MSKKMSLEWGEAEEQIIDMKESGRRESEREKSRQREEKKRGKVGGADGKTCEKEEQEGDREK